MMARSTNVPFKGRIQKHARPTLPWVTNRSSPPTLDRAGLCHSCNTNIADCYHSVTDFGRYLCLRLNAHRN
jgi:hypothetical protein